MTIPSSVRLNKPQPPEGTRPNSSTRRRARSVRERVDLLLELTVYGRHRGAADTGTVEVLERREQGRNARLLLGLRVASGEGDGDGRVVDRMASRNVRVQGLGET